nr:MAG TPA: hypothetical protein [Caudoviricetes sp.]
MENLLQNIASGLWIVLGVYCCGAKMDGGDSDAAD